MQQTTFPFEIIINDDASTDGTTEVLKEYQEKYPDIVFPVFHEENQYSKGLRSLTARNIFPIARGKYFAMCEGDDYWADPLKLQKQVDFLEKNPDCSCCYHPVRWVYVGGDMPDKIEGPNLPGENKFSSEAIIGGRYIRTVTMVFRSAVIKEIPEWIFSSPYGDIPLQLICATKGKIGYLGGAVMAVYRRGVEGAWSENEFADKKTKVKWVKKYIWEQVIMFDLFNKNSDYKFNNLLKRRKRKIIIEKLLDIQKLNGRLEMLKLTDRYFNELFSVTDRRVLEFWLHFIFGKRLLVSGKAFVRKLLRGTKARKACLEPS